MGLDFLLMPDRICALRICFKKNPVERINFSVCADSLFRF
jgi:hypothetical protein